MKSASSNAYISTRMVAAYKIKRAERKQSKNEEAAGQLPVKVFADEEEKKEVVQSEIYNENKSLQKQQSQTKKKGMLASLFSFGSKEKKDQTAGESKSLARVSSSEEELDEDQYLQRNISCENVDSDDLEGGLQYSDCEDNSRVNFRAQKRQERVKKGKQARATKYHMEVDTNVFEVQFQCLQDAAELATGDPEICPNCQAIFNVYSCIKSGDDQIWKCEFCNNENSVMLEEGEIPKTSAVSFLVKAPAQVEESKMSGQDISVIFCLDVSGSMCVTQAVDGKLKLKSDKLNKLQQSLSQFGDGSDQFMSQNEKNQTYVSRLQCVQAAVETQLDQMSKGAPDRKIGIVTFNGEVTVFGDGHADPVHIAGDKLLDYDFLEKNGRSQASKVLNKPIKETAKMLTKKLMSIEETGPTALGPAVLTSIAMALDGKPGSTVVICTDGLANVGLGSFDDVKSVEDLAKVEAFYERIGQLAQKHGVTVNLVSIEGDDCNIESLSKICELTGGNVNRVNPVTLNSNFSNIFATPVIATNVVTKVKLHKGLRFRNELEQNLNSDQTLLVRESGNVTVDDLFTFEYTIKTLQELLEMEDLDLEQLKQIPFQAQITYTTLDGAKMVRVITQQKQVASERESLEKSADQEMLKRNCIQQSSKIARGGDLKRAQAVAKTYKRHMQEYAVSDNQIQNMKDFQEDFAEVYQQLNEVKEVQNAYDSDYEQEQMDQCMQQSQDQSCSPLQMGSMVQSSAPMRKNAKKNDALSANLFKFSKNKKK